MSSFKTLSLAVFIVVADQLSKWAVMEQILRPLYPLDNEPRGLMEWLANAPERLPFIGMDILPFFNLVVVWNQGVSFGWRWRRPRVCVWSRLRSRKRAARKP